MQIPNAPGGVHGFNQAVWLDVCTEKHLSVSYQNTQQGQMQMRLLFLVSKILSSGDVSDLYLSSQVLNDHFSYVFALWLEKISSKWINVFFIWNIF